MAFTLNTFQFGRGVATAAINGNGVSTVIHGYKTDDTFVTVAGSEYFPVSLSGDKLFDGDLISIVSADTVALCKITGLDPFTIGADLYASAGNPLVMSVPVAATDANGIKITGTTVQMEIASATLPGIITALDQDLAGIKMFNSGIKLLTFGGTPTTLNYYEDYTHSSTYTLGAETTSSVNLRLLRIGSVVTLFSGSFVTTPGQGAPGTHYVGNTALPARFRPVTAMPLFWRMENGGVFNAGMIYIDTTGVISFYNSADPTVNFTAAQINGFNQGSATYLV